MNITGFRDLRIEHKLEYIRHNIKEKVKDNKVLALVSGGKDSTLALYLAYQAGLNIVKLVNFTHKWTWQLYRPQLEKLAEKTGIELEYIDFSEQILTPTPVGLIGYVGIPCKFCKTQIFSKIYNMARLENSPVVLSGYNLMDDISAIILRHLDEKELNHDYMEYNQISKYVHDSKIMELRPVIRLTDEEVLQSLALEDIEVQRTHEANPQFNYWREGCPMQYLDRDVPITAELLEESSRLNHRLSKFAKERGIRASIFVPGKKILTIPNGHEEECAQYLMKTWER